MAVLGPRFCARAFSSCGKWGPLFIAVRRPLTIAASLVAEHRLQTRRLSNCGSRAQLLRGMWDLPRPGLEPASPALAGRFSTSAPPGKPTSVKFNYKCLKVDQKEKDALKVNKRIMIFNFYCTEQYRSGSYIVLPVTSVLTFRSLYILRLETRFFSIWIFKWSFFPYIINTVINRGSNMYWSKCIVSNM